MLSCPRRISDPANEITLDHPAMIHQPDQTNLCVTAGDAVVIDYRLLHGTHENATALRRDCILLTFTPNWRDLPSEIKGHLISHPAQPSDSEDLSDMSFQMETLPRFDGLEEI